MSISSRWPLAMLLAAVVGLSSTSARADCTPDSVGSGESVVCDGNDTDGFSDGSDDISITVNDGAVVSNSGDAIKAEGDDVTILNDGTIDGGDEGVQGGDGLTLTNNGTITAVDKGIDVDDKDDVTIINNGTIEAGDKGIRGGNGANFNITNSGTITSGDEGIEAGNNATITNSGTISAVDDAIQVGENAIIVNTGTIKGTAADGDGIDIDSGSIFNSGSILSYGDGEAGIDYDGSTITSTITNTGTIRGYYGVLTDPANTASQIIVNSGTIEGTGGTAIEIGDGDDSLTLLSGARVIGNIDLGAGNDTLVIGDGLSAALSFTSLPETIEIGSSPFVANGTMVGVVDPTSIGQMDEQLSLLTGSISNTINNRLAAGRTYTSGNTGARMTIGQRAGSLKDAPVYAGDGGGVFASAFGGWGEQDDSELTVLGGLVGVDGKLSANSRLGVFAGYARNELEVGDGAQNMDADSWFAGAYGSVQSNAFFADLVVTAGSSDYDSKRLVLNNLTSTGIDTASGDFDGIFIAPELTIGTRAHIGGIEVVPSARIGYAHLYVDGYTETGSAGSLHVDSHDVAVLKGRAQIAFPVARLMDNGGIARFEPRIGIEGRTAMGDDEVGATLLGQAVVLDADGDESDFTGFVGASASVPLSAGSAFFVDTELHAGDDGINRAEALAGVKVKF